MSGPRKPKDRQVGADAKRAQAITLLIAGWAQKDIAVSLSVHESTVSKWLAEPDVRAEIDRAGNALVTDAVAKVQRLSTLAVDTLEALMLNGDEGSTRLGAAKAVLDRIERLAPKSASKVEHSGEVRAPIIIVESAVDVQAMRAKARALEARTSEQEKDDDE